ncbi:hypothetical protein FRB90_006691, partial [Tulasnella sp. 427]
MDLDLKEPSPPASHRIPEPYQLASYPTSQLPNELLSLVFECICPPVDVLSEGWSHEQSVLDLDDLYTLRRVSKLWKEVVDGTPTLWTLISSTFPAELNRISAVRSGTRALSIYYGERRGVIQPFGEFLSLIEPHSHRWGRVALELGSEPVDKLPVLDSRQLVALKIEVLESESDSEDEDEDDTPTPDFHISHETASQIEVLELVHLPIDWLTSFGHLRRLRSLTLEGRFRPLITYEDVLETIAANPDLELLCLVDLEFKETGTGPCSNLIPIILQDLKSITLGVDIVLITWILKRVQVPSHVVRFDIRAGDLSTLSEERSLWMDAAVPWIPVLRRLCLSSKASQVHLAEDEWNEMTGGEEASLHIEFAKLPVVEVLGWIRDVVGEEPDGRIEIWAKVGIFEMHGVLDILKRLPGIEMMTITDTPEAQSTPPLQMLFNTIGRETLVVQEGRGCQ